MARTLYSITMSFLASLIAGPVVADIVNMMNSDLGLSQASAIGFAFTVFWTVLILCDLVLYRAKPSESYQKKS